MIIFVWARVVYDHPDDHPRMSNKEINYIKNGRRDSDNVKVFTTFTELFGYIIYFLFILYVNVYSI